MALVKQGQLDDVLGQRDLIKALKANLKQAEDELLRLELVTIGALDKGGTIERGPLGAVVEEMPGQRRPKWKEAFAEAMGPVEVQKIIDVTPYGAPTRHLVVTERGQVRK